MDIKRKKSDGVTATTLRRAYRLMRPYTWVFAGYVVVLTIGCSDSSIPTSSLNPVTPGSGAGGGSGFSGSGGVAGAVSGGVGGASGLGGSGGASGLGGSGGVNVVATGGSTAIDAGMVLDGGGRPPVDASITATVDTSIPTVIDSGAGDGAPLGGGSGGADPSVSGTGSGGFGNTDGNCPEGFNSVLPLKLTGDTVPGNLELGLATAPETPRNPCGTPEEQICFNLINAERERNGKAPFIWDGDLADLGRSHAADRNQQVYLGTQHGSSTNSNHLYQERAQFLGLKSGKFMGVVENACMGAFGGQGAFNCWMSSPGHYDVMMGNGSWAILKYAACGGDGSQWNLELGY